MKESEVDGGAGSVSTDSIKTNHVHFQFSFGSFCKSGGAKRYVRGKS